MRIVERHHVAVVAAAAAWALALVCSGSGVATGALATDKASIDSVVAGNNAFAFDLYRELAKDEGNLFLSPYSISTALGMTYAGARGATAGQMAKVLHFTVAQEKLHPALSELMGTLGGAGKSYQLAVANALWGQTGYRFLPEFLEITDRHYGAGFKEVDYVDDGSREQTRQTINKWVEARTNNKITELIQRGDLSSLTRLVLTNAIYFKGQWELRFEPKATREMPFHVSEKEHVAVPMMYQTAQLNYGENGQAQILEMPYAGGDLSMVVLLPKPGYGLAKLEAALRSESVQTWLSQLERRQVEVFLPRFKLEKRFLLNGKLRDLGMVDAFGEGAADFSGMASGTRLHISGAIHKAFVEVNEEGTEAAAATGVVVGITSVSLQGPPVFRADRPFVFLIRDLRSGSTLFIGRLVDPRT